MSIYKIYIFHNRTNVSYIFKWSNLFIIFSVFIVSSCASMRAIPDNFTKIIQEKQFSDEFSNISSLIYVDIDNQTLFFLKKGTVKKTYRVSTSVYGTGNKENSLKTPLGKHKISQKIGDNLPFAAILKGRLWTGEVAKLIIEKKDTNFDIVTSRILWLEGLEEGINKGPGIDSKSRFIYIHGTAEEGLIGELASNGCVRMYNSDVIDLYSRVTVNTQVWIF